MDILREIKQRLDNGHSLSEICKSINIDYMQTYKKVKQCPYIQISTKSNGKSKASRKAFDGKRKITEDQKDQIVNWYQSGHSMSWIASKLNTTGATVMAFFHKNNISIRSKRENQLRRLDDPDYRKKLIEYGHLGYQARRKSHTSIELIFSNYLTSNNLEFESQFRRVGNKHPYDFYIPKYNIIVEIDGLYWHDKPKQQIKDKIQTQQALDQGFNILRIITDRTITEDIYEQIFNTFIEENRIGFKNTNEPPITGIVRYDKERSIEIQ